ncbi:YobI family P-loop NTPase [Lactobacillus helveticus]|uniref:YobI family P-loop NTPase n=1 Tax=Lactobacillus helveticus TaxID=1587 RepID=UPI001561FD21|nr:hypothetical protein [Lactobacillus helveticus]NRO20428.1 hypothetical protein [Lactobacillus helveticus]
MFHRLWQQLLQFKIEDNNQKNETFTDLAPTDHIDNDQKYVDALDWALSDERIKNIAITGPYGAGKSSIIASYLKKRPYIKKKSLNVSLANFSKKETVSSKSDKKAFSEKDIQRSILKQLFYKTKPSKIPLSRYRKLYKPNAVKIFIILALVFLFISMMNYIFNYASFNKSIELIGTAYIRLINKGTPPILLNLAIGIIGFLTVCLVLKLISYLYSRFSISKINLGSFAEASQDMGSSIFDKNMDEIMYFFENTGYKIVFFEDLDRWNNSSIFLHLRELNSILNKDELIKEPIVFVYAIDDGFFNNDEERTKFFDFIIPVIPVMTSTNAGEFLIDKLKDYEDISDKFIYDVSPYISNIRILDNICNEFRVYEPIIIEKQGLRLSREKLLALIIFKNLYPQDFVELEKENGIVKDAFDKKDEYIEQIRKNIQADINTERERLKEIKEENFSSYKEVISAFLAAVTGYEGLATHFYCSRTSDITANQLISKEKNLTDLRNGEVYKINFRNFSENRECIQKSLSDKLIDKYIKHVDLIGQKNETGVEKLQQNIEHQKEKIEKLETTTLKDLIEKYNIIDQLPDDVMKNDLLVFLLRRGYIDEQYANYINYFKDTSITNEDQNFILSIKNRRRLAQDFHLTKVSNIVSRLQDFEFNQKEIYNNDLLNYLLNATKRDEINKLDSFISQLADETDDSWKFIEEYLHHSGKNESKFIQKLAHAWPNMLIYIKNRADISSKKFDEYFNLTFMYADVEDIQAMNKENVIAKYLSSDKNSLQKFNELSIDRAKSILDVIPVKFSDNHFEQIDKELFWYIVNHNDYQIDCSVLYAILGVISHSLQENFDQHAYTNLLELDDELPINKYLLDKDNVLNFVRNIILISSNTKETAKAINSLLTKVDDENVQEQILKHENYIFTNIDDLATDYWNIALRTNKIEPIWSNIIKYWNKYKFSTDLIDFINNDVDQIKKDDPKNCSPEFRKAFVAEDNEKIEDSTYVILLSRLEIADLNLDLNAIPERILKILVEEKKIEFSKDAYEDIESMNNDIAVEFVLDNQTEALANFDNINFENVVMSLLANSRTKEDLINRIIESYSHLYDKVTKEVALNLLDKESIVFKNNWFYAIWNYLNDDQKKEWLLKNIDNLELKDFEECFKDMNGIYHEFFEKLGTTKEVKLSVNVNNLKLASRLKAVKYITSFKDKGNMLKLKLKRR